VQLTIRIKPEKVSVRLNFFDNSKIIDRNLRNSVDFKATLLYFGITKNKIKKKASPENTDTGTHHCKSHSTEYLPCQKRSGHGLTPNPQH
jgi:hypothetical protein